MQQRVKGRPLLLEQVAQVNINLSLRSDNTGVCLITSKSAVTHILTSTPDFCMTTYTTKTQICSSFVACVPSQTACVPNVCVSLNAVLNKLISQ